ncbi:nuclear transcription factor Y subunit A-3-like [Macadamia integrifolia]|uniref:nuclear transcription factor Y subunit A-3-like n=1 Tax=Macadamia integrifolia TaxID=60698 RepID=UPI001C4FD72B|nr:nuclear transcription factor Y subunit A-3-like [Macadamia integrifolia]XP_042508203.1 nuclear transcription factor Y subunit A-3-like [Macadamia integrifolia]XP_042508204.1 nuclear transcription factor Y subunit A-3-like [Macadamia integrifolia]XP_042508206.1 nuclear transcription factor Y subunit A-3-like [Macadamia integrifolia]
MGSPPWHGNAKHLGQLQDQDSSSTQSTGQSHHDVVAVGGGAFHGQCISAQSGIVQRYGKRTGHMKPVVSLGNPDFVFPASQVDFSQTVAPIQYCYADPYVGGLVAAYGPQAIIHPQMMGIAPARVPLPHDLAKDEPVYVNAKQYRAIVRRRQSRAKLDSQNKLIKGRKPYLHESRHLHALKRVRGSGGRFLNAKKPQQSNPGAAADDRDASDFGHLQLGGNLSESEVLQSENGNGSVSCTSCSDVTSGSNGDEIYHQSDTRFLLYPPDMDPTMQGGDG